MMKIKKILIVVSLLSLVVSNLSADNFNWKKTEEFKTLSEFKTVEDFEKYYEVYIQNCLDNRKTDIQGIKCMIGDDLWDRELNIYYKKIMAKLNTEDKKNLKQSQQSWLKMRDLTFKLNLNIIVKNYPNDGTMYRLMGSHDLMHLKSYTIKERVMVLKYLFELETPNF